MRNSSSTSSSGRHRAKWSATLLAAFLLQLQLSAHGAHAQTQNQPPHFVPGSGDMSRFSLLENTPVGSPVYQLRGKSVPVVNL